MRKYGGLNVDSVKENDLNHEEPMKFKYISEKWLNELFSHREEYQTMFEDYFQKYQDVKISNDTKDKQLKIKDDEIEQLKQQLYLTSEGNNNLKVENAAKSSTIKEQQDEITGYQSKIDQLESSLNIAEAKVERVYERLAESEAKVNHLLTTNNMLKTEMETLRARNILYVNKVEGLQTSLDDYKSIILDFEQGNKTKLSDINTLKVSLSNMITANDETQQKCQILSDDCKMWKHYVNVYKCWKDIVYEKLCKHVNAYEGRKFKKLRKASKKAMLINEIKLNFEENLGKY